MADQSSREIFMAGFKAGATLVVREATRILGQPVKITPWDYRDELRAERAWRKYLSEPDKLHRERRPDRSRKKG